MENRAQNGHHIEPQKFSDLLHKYYYNIKEPVSFQSVKKLFEKAKETDSNIKLHAVAKWLSSQPTYGVHRYVNRNFKRNPIVSRHIDHNWHADLVEIDKPSANSRYRYLLMVIDNLSKYGWSIKLFNKKAKTVKNAFSSIVKKSKRKPIIVTTDAGKEFTNHLFRNALKRNKIKHMIVQDYSKAAVVERWNRTIKEKIHKYLTYHKTFRFVDVLNDIINGYNNTVHSRTKYKPIDVNKFNEHLVYRNLYNIKQIHEKQSFKIGDKIRVVLGRELFDKGYKENYSKEIFTISKVLISSPHYKYKVKDKKGTVVRGTYYAKELMKV